MKKHIFKYSSFEAAEKAAMEKFIEKGFDLRSANKFFDGFSGKQECYYSPGVYRFKTFEEARMHDLQMMIEHSVTRHKC